MKVTITIDCPERAYRRCFETELPAGGARELFADLCEVVDIFEVKKMIEETNDKN